MKLKQLREMTLIKSSMFGMSMEFDFKQDFKNLKLLKDTIKPLNNKLYSGDDIFYLTDDNDNYIGHLEYINISRNIIKVTSSYSKQRGFYKLLFKLILILTNIKMIFGDDEQSTDAIAAWKSVLKGFKKKVYNTETNEVEDFIKSKEDDYWVYERGSHKKYLVGLSEADNCIKDSYNKIESLIASRKNKRITDMTFDYLTRTFDFSEEEAIEMIKSIGKKVIIKDAIIVIKGD